MDIIENRLKGFGLELTLLDQDLLIFLKNKVENYIRAECNRGDIPVELEETVVDMVVGEYLLNKKSAGQLKDIDIEPLLVSLQEGDTTVKYRESKSRDEQLDYLIRVLMSPRVNIYNYRKMRW